jgi:Domain of unknown function (DUF6398)
MSVPRSHRNRPYRHLAAVGPDTIPSFSDDAWPRHEERPYAALDAPKPDLFADLLPYTGDIAALLDLDTEPIPDEPFDRSGVAPQDEAIATAVLERCDAACDALLDVEFRTIARRILALVATRDPRPLRRSAKPDRIAAGVVWLAGRGNGEFGRRAPQWRSAARLWEWFGVTSCADRGQSLRSAAGLIPDTFDAYGWDMRTTPLGTVALLHSRTRESLIIQRDALLRVERERRRWSISPDGRTVACHAARVGPLTVARGHDADRAEAVVLVALGANGVGIDDADVYGLSVPDARRLLEMLRRALAPN